MLQYPNYSLSQITSRCKKQSSPNDKTHTDQEVCRCDIIIYIEANHSMFRYIPSKSLIKFCEMLVNSFERCMQYSRNEHVSRATRNACVRHFFAEISISLRSERFWYLWKDTCKDWFIRIHCTKITWKGHNCLNFQHKLMFNCEWRIIAF